MVYSTYGRDLSKDILVYFKANPVRDAESNTIKFPSSPLLSPYPNIYILLVVVIIPYPEQSTGILHA